MDRARLDALADFLADPVAFCLQVASLLLQIALLLGDQLQFGEINSLASPPQLLGDRFGVVTHKALIEHGSRSVSAGSLWQSVSEHLADHHRRNAREQGDAKGGERALPLRDGHCRDHAGTKAGHAELSSDVVAALHVGPAIFWTVGLSLIHISEPTRPY